MKLKLVTLLFFFPLFLLYSCNGSKDLNKKSRISIAELKKSFLNPPDSARPGVYWYFMDGNMSKVGMTKDLESMKQSGISNLIFLEVNVGIPRGPVDFLSAQWLELFKYAVGECERLGIRMTLGIGPGWTGSGGPWVSPDQSMQHLVSSSIQVSGVKELKIKLPLPQPKKPYFGEGSFTPELKKQWNDFYGDIAVIAFPTPAINRKIEDIDEKALYYRAPYSSKPGVKSFLPSLDHYPVLPDGAIIPKNMEVNLTDRLLPDGTLNWKVPPGNWTIMRFGRRNNGALTRPAPLQGLGFECDKFDTIALNSHLDQYVGKILHKIGTLDTSYFGGLKMLHMDSWEMGSQNWTSKFRQEFIKRRGYDPLPFYPVYAGLIVESQEISERFLWDLRLTSQELVLDYHAEQVKKYAHRHGLGLSIEPYDMNPTADLDLGSIADIPMCEFWSKGYGFNSTFSCMEATSIAHLNGIPIVQAEAFTAGGDEAWKQYPGSMKNQGDWAFAAGINRFFYHTFEHKPLADSLRPGMTMGPYGVHWDRKQTWWPMVDGYHKYITRCQYILQQGQPVADILYLTPEGAPQVFRAPASAFSGEVLLPDRRGYNFDGCSPSELHTANVKDHKIVFPGGATYRILVMPAVETMTTLLLAKIESLVKAGAIIIGNPPHKSPSLVNYPECDNEVAALANSIWGNSNPPANMTEITKGDGKIYWGGSLSGIKYPNLYPDYKITAEILQKMGIPEDFESPGPIRYTHHSLKTADIYFVSNKTDGTVNVPCTFRVSEGTPELWDPLSGETRSLPNFTLQKERILIPLQFEPFQSYFIVFNRETQTAATKSSGDENFPKMNVLAEVKPPWQVSFNPKWGGPANIVFDTLADWTSRPESGIKYYSGIATYRNSISLPDKITGNVYLDLGEVNNLARIRINGKNMGVVWTEPYRINISGAVVPGENQIEIEVANLWPNRLIGDEQFPDDGIKNGMWPEWLLKKQPRTSGRYTFTTYKFYSKDSPLLKSGLIGPVRILIKSK